MSDTLANLVSSGSTTTNLDNIDGKDADVNITVSDTGGTSFTATDLKALGNSTTGTVTVTNAVNISGTEADVTAALVTGSSKVVAATANVTVTTPVSAAQAVLIADATTGTVSFNGGLTDDLSALASSGSVTSNMDKISDEDGDVVITIADNGGVGVTATDLSAVGSDTTGTVTVSNAVVITGSRTQVTDTLVTSSSKVVASTALVTINDAGSTAMNATDLSDIGSATGGAVTVSNAVAITGSEAEVTAALVTGASSVVAATSTVTINDVDNVDLTAANLTAIGNSTTGQVTVSNAVNITGNVAEINSALVTAGSTVVLSSGTATVKATGVGDTSDLSGVTQGGTLTAELVNSADITSNTNLTTVDIFVLANNASVEMKIAQHNLLDATNTGTGTNTVTLTDGVTAFTGKTSVENYVLFTGANEMTMASTSQNVTGNSGIDTILGGSGANQIDGNGGLDILTGGGGADIFIFNSGDAFTDTTQAGVTYETINDFSTAAGDQIKIGLTPGAYGEADGSGHLSSGFKALADDFFDNTAGGVDVYVLYNVSGFGDGLLAVDMNGNGALETGDLVIKLIGVNSDDDLSNTDIIF